MAKELKKNVFWLVPFSGSGFLKVRRTNEHRLGLALNWAVEEKWIVPGTKCQRTEGLELVEVWYFAPNWVAFSWQVPWATNFAPSFWWNSRNFGIALSGDIYLGLFLVSGFGSVVWQVVVSLAPWGTLNSVLGAVRLIET